MNMLDVTAVVVSSELSPQAHEVLLSCHDRPGYSRDPGDGFALWRRNGHLYVSLYWDGADRMVCELIAK